MILAFRGLSVHSVPEVNVGSNLSFLKLQKKLPRQQIFQTTWMMYITEELLYIHTL